MSKVYFHHLSQKAKKNYMQNVSALYGNAEPVIQKPIKRKKRNNLEALLQQSLVTWAREKGLPLISIPNHGKRTAWGGMKEVAMGLTKGVSDLFLARPTAYHAGMWIELKAPGKRPTAEQQEWLARMQHEGYCAMWFDDFDLAVAAIERYLS